MNASFPERTFIRANKNLSFGRKASDARLVSDNIEAQTFPVKTYVIIDTFNKKNIDIDGDGIDDIPHGEFICRLIKSLNPNAKTIPFMLSNLDSNEYVIRRHKGFIKFIKKVKPDAINRSVGDICSFQELNRDIKRAVKKESQGASFKRIRQLTSNIINSLRIGTKNSPPESINKPPNSEIITRENFTTYQDIIRKVLKEDAKKGSILSTLDDITKEGFKLFNAGGNSGSDHFAIECLAEGVNVIGSTDGQRNVLANSSDLETMKFAQGIFGISTIKDDSGKVLGYDLTGNGRIAIKAEEVSSNGKFIHPVLKEYAGKPLKECIIPDDKYAFLQEYYDTPFRNSEKVMQLQNKWGLSSKQELMDEARSIYEKYLMSVEQVESLGIYDDERIKEFKEIGKFKKLFSDNICFDVDQDGLLIYDPEHSGRREVINYRSGSSYATPAYMVINDIEEANKVA